MPDYQPGDIYKFTTPEEGARHPYAILGEYDSNSYLGCMITHGDPKDWVDNMPMEEGDFVKLDEEGKAYKVRYSTVKGIGSHFMRVGLKKHTELDVYRAGKLTATGFEKLNEIVRKTTPEFWDEFVVYSEAQKELNREIARDRKRGRK